MGWDCGACTFHNASDAASTCEVCTALRPGREVMLVDLTADSQSWDFFSEGPTHNDIPPAAAASSISSSKPQPSRNMKQRNLFGAVVKSPANQGASKQRKRKDPPAGPVSQQQVNWQTPFQSKWNQAMKNMKEIFGIDELRGLQPAAIEGTLRRSSQIVVMATGGGKSLCFQLPATVLGGVSLVVSPLIALMVDQVRALNDKGVAAALVSSANTAVENRNVMDRLLGRPNKKNKNIAQSPITMLYVTPELVGTDRFRKVLEELHQQERLALFAIDEAHCLSTWGHDFRPAYRKLSWLRTTFPKVPCMACTATATPQVIADIRDTLLLKDATCHMGSFNRPNISYEVRYKETLDAMGGALEDLVQLVREQHEAASQRSLPCSGIIYVHKRHDCDVLAKQISKAAGIRAAAYHGGLKDADRANVQRQWTNGTVDVAVATIAFGMGIDLSHVRYVIHWSLAKTVEGFYQESGRAGRDGLAAISVLYYSKDEASKFSYLITQQESKSRKDPQSKKQSTERSLDALQRMVNYCITPCCRRQYLLEHFGEKIDSKSVCQNTCDYCQNPKLVEKRIDASQVVKDVLETGRRGRNGQSGSPSKWDGQWSKPHGDEEVDDWQDVLTVGDLGITSSAGLEDLSCDTGSAKMPTEQSFVKASSILDKYERMESKGSSGFVHFKSKGEPSRDVKPRAVVIPEHLRSALPDPLRHLANGKKEALTSAKSSSGAAAEADRLKGELAKLKEKREQTASRLKAIQSKSKAAAPPPPPPPPTLSFATKKNRK